MRVWFAGSLLGYPVGGHFWVQVHWLLALRALGCEVVYLEEVVVEPGPATLESASRLKALFDAHDVEASLAVVPYVPDELAAKLDFPLLSIDDVSQSDALISRDKTLREEAVQRFARSAFLDVDPGITQGYVHSEHYDLSSYDAHFTVGEGAAKPADGLDWQYVPPCVVLDRWPVARAERDSAFTTVTQWRAPRRWYFDGEKYQPNDKRLGFEPYLELPRRVRAPLELAIPVDEDLRPERFDDLKAQGWRVRDSGEIADPSKYRAYIQGSLGEFSCAKPGYVELQTAWTSDRTVSYLASGKPAVVQDTGPSAYLPDRAGLLRFRDFEDAVECVEDALEHYDDHCSAARALAEEHFDAQKVAPRVLNRLT